jgi:CRISPR/Cas system-associated exonuclease Cas4 (RecB family)
VPDVYEALQAIARDRRADPLAPVTVIAPSHAAALQLRRRLAEIEAFAAVRFETLPRVAELLGAGHLAASGRSPLARPIGDYVAEQVALDSRPPLDAVRDVPGYARVLRQIFRRLRRGGICASADVQIARHGHLGEILRLYDAYSQRTSAFYDEEDLLDAAADAVRANRAGVLADLGDIYVVPPGAQTAAGLALLAALPGVTLLDDAAAAPQESFLIAPDPASEAQEAVRNVLTAIASGTPIHEIAVFYGAAEVYPGLLHEAFAAAGVASVPLPGIPVAQTRAGRGVLALARLPQLDYARTAVIDFLSVAPVKEWLPSTNGNVHEATTAWDNVSRDAQITHGAGFWRTRLETYARGRETEAARLDPAEYEIRIAIFKSEAERARRLVTVIEQLISRLEPLRAPQPADQFIAAFKQVVADYCEPDAGGLTEALEEIDQLGTIGAVGGQFALDSFAESLAANLDARYIRPEKLGNGVIIADYRAAAGMRFQHVILCGAFEGAFPAGPGADSILDDGVWKALHDEHPQIEDTGARLARAREAAERAVAAAAGCLTWSAPAFEPGAVHEYYPSPMMAEAASAIAGRRITATELRNGTGAATTSGLDIRRLASPLAASLRGPVLTSGELAVRAAIDLKRRHADFTNHERHRSVLALRSRRSGEFSEWDGNLAVLNDPGWLEVQRAVSPTKLEDYGVCGYRYFCKSLLNLNVVEEPDEKQTMDARVRGTLVHEILEKFFREQQARSRPQANEAWTRADLDRLMQITDNVLGVAREAGQTGLDIFAQHESRTIRADLARFLEADTAFRRETGAVPTDFEISIPETDIAGVRLRGRVDRIDRAPDGRQAWVIDYKTGSSWDTKGMDSDPLKGGAKLQLPVYLAAVQGAEEATALYWYITQRGDFARIEYTPTPERDARFQATLRAIVDGIRAGAFPAVPNEEDEWKGGFKNCTFCDFDRICSRRRDLEFAAKEEDPGMAPWRNVAAAAGGDAAT